MTLDSENYTPDEQVIAAAVEGPTFDDLMTGEIPVHSAKVAAQPKLPNPVPYVQGSAELGLPTRHRASTDTWLKSAAVAVAATVGVFAAVALETVLGGAL